MSNQEMSPEMPGRRNLLKSLAALPFVGALSYGTHKKFDIDKSINDTILKEMGLDDQSGVFNNIIVASKTTPHLRVGIVGAGGRGRHLMQAAGFAPPEYIDDWRFQADKNSDDKRYEDFLNQDDLNISIVAVCDVFDEHARLALEAASNAKKAGKSEFGGITVKRYNTYHELIADKDIDAIIIGTPDHWHAPVAIEAVKAGKHVYVEKPMTYTVEETYELREAVRKSNVILQVGHQGRQTDSYIKAREVIQKNILGKISLIEVTTNRNSPNGAWVYDIHPKASPETIDWKQFVGPSPLVPFSLERFFRWRCWWDYGTGLSGDLLTHEFDAINQVMNIGIPHSVVASGGIYFYKDGREVPDVFHAVCEYPHRDLTFVYSASLASDRHRGKVFMGHDGNMEMDGNTTVYVDRESTRFKHLIEKGLLNPDEPAFVFSSSKGKIDAVTSPTAKYFAKRGLLYTYRDGKKSDTTHLHIKEWLHCIRQGIQPSCNVDEGFQGSITAHMATLSYREGKKVYWDADKEKIITDKKA